MVNVYVVDDEKLVRRGIIGLIDWEKYDMKVVGDSGSGEEAAEFIRNNDVNLLFSDLQMPGLSGVPFLRDVRAIRPDMQIVVLTMHQEFDLIQQALRIGILDYITKAQIEEENIDALMLNVKKRYLEAMHHSRLGERKITGNEVYIWETERKEREEAAVMLLTENRLPFEVLTENHLIIPRECNIILLKSLIKDYGAEKSTLLELKRIKGTPYDQLKDILQTVMKGRLFADRLPGCFTYTYLYPELLAGNPGLPRTEIIQLSMKMEFMLDGDRYEDGMEKIKYANLSLEERTAVFYRFNLYWSEFSGKDFTRYFEEVGHFLWWYQWKEWFDEIRRLVLKKIGGTNEEISTMEAIHKAMNHIREYMDREITLEELLHLTGMSKSHFSRNFKKITGKTFVTYMNDMRIDSAKKYLTETKQSISWIAGQVGYSDEHYFRRIFKERTGKNPKKFRESN
jgi:two-component system response regulator YesN